MQSTEHQCLFDPCIRIDCKNPAAKTGDLLIPPYDDPDPGAVHKPGLLKIEHYISYSFLQNISVRSPSDIF